MRSRRCAASSSCAVAYILQPNNSTSTNPKRTTVISFVFTYKRQTCIYKQQKMLIFGHRLADQDIKKPNKQLCKPLKKVLLSALPYWQQPLCGPTPPCKIPAPM